MSATPRPVPSILGALLAMIGLASLVAGAALLFVHSTQRDADGFYTSSDYRIETSTHAIVSEDLDLGTHPADWFPARGDLTFRVTATSLDESGLFVGIADSDDVVDYLEGVSHARITSLGRAPDGLSLSSEPGGAPARAPADEPLWEASAEGAGTQTLSWDAEGGSWTLVVMRADGTDGVAVDAAAAVRTGLLLPLGLGLMGFAALVLAGATVLLVVGLSGRRTSAVAGPERVRTPYAIRLEGQLDRDLSRGMWLVKWFLAIPHAVVLAFLWLAFSLLTVVAGVAILFTGRYPRGIFDFNVGVLRWTWRVTHYAFGVLGTDRYPPFTLAPDPGYPADLDVSYPGELSRGLVLVKWWLLAIPHYLVVGLLTGSLLTWTLDVGGPGDAGLVLGGGVIGALALVAGLSLLFSGRYPQGLFDLLVGLNRWVYRVITYAALMTDDYPPFRLDAGGTEPPSGEPEPPVGPDVLGTGERELTRT